uniref:Uncharacterized protein n=1 Tax=Sphaerodactylus townsendi TaxID=933632 RepID=A0ACB8EHA8_9SAUR
MAPPPLHSGSAWAQHSCPGVGTIPSLDLTESPGQPPGTGALASESAMEMTGSSPCPSAKVGNGKGAVGDYRAWPQPAGWDRRKEEPGDRDGGGGTARGATPAQRDGGPSCRGHWQVPEPTLGRESENDIMRLPGNDAMPSRIKRKY